MPDSRALNLSICKVFVSCANFLFVEWHLLFIQTFFFHDIVLKMEEELVVHRISCHNMLGSCDFFHCSGSESKIIHSSIGETKFTDRDN